MAMRASPPKTIFSGFKFVLLIVIVARAQPIGKSTALQKEGIAKFSDSVLLLTDGDNVERVIQRKGSKGDGSNIDSMPPSDPVAGVPNASIVIPNGTTTTDHPEIENTTLAAGETTTTFAGSSTTNLFEVPEHTKPMHGADADQEVKPNVTDELHLDGDELSGAAAAMLSLSPSTQTAPSRAVSTTTSTQPGVSATASLTTTSVHTAVHATAIALPNTAAMASSTTTTTSAQSPATVSSTDTSAQPAAPAVEPVTGMDPETHGRNSSSADAENDGASPVSADGSNTSSANATHIAANRGDADMRSDTQHVPEVVINDFSPEDREQLLPGADKKQQHSREQHNHDQSELDETGRFWTFLGGLALLSACMCLCMIIYKVTISGRDSNFQKMVESRTPKRFGRQGDESPVYQFAMV